MTRPAWLLIACACAACAKRDARSLAQSYVELIALGKTDDAAKLHCASLGGVLHPFQSALAVSTVDHDRERWCVEGTVTLDDKRGSSVAIDIWDERGLCIKAVRVFGSCKPRTR